MTQLVPVTKERHAGLTWRRPANYLHIAQDPVVVIVAQEVPRVMGQMALAFIENEDGYMPIAVQGLKPGQNKFVSQDGRWLADYVPFAYRSYPFKLARNQSGNEILCIDEAAGNVGNAADGEPFFLADGSPAPTVMAIFQLLVQIEKDRKSTRKSCDVLARHRLLEPWSVKAQDGTEQFEANGIFRIAETVLYALSPEELAEVRNSGGLMLAFAQLFSMQQIQKLGKTIPSSDGEPGSRQVPKLLDEDGIISFANL
jgi:hypothetical protein